MISSLGNIRLIALNEFGRLFSHPVTIVLFCLIIVFAILSGMAGLSILPAIDSATPEYDVFIQIGMTQQFLNISQYCSVAALVLGVLSIAEERRKALVVLLTKPLFRRDVTTGKFIGLSIFMLLSITVAYLIVCVIITLVFREPLSLSDFALRFTALIFILSLHCSLSAGIGMLIGLLFTTLKDAIIVCVTVLFVEWFSGGKFDFLDMINPVNVYIKMFSPVNGVMLLDPGTLFNTWLCLAFPFIGLTLIEIAIVYVIDCYASIKLEDY